MKIIHKKITQNCITIIVEKKYWFFSIYQAYSGAVNREGNVYTWTAQPENKRANPEMEETLCKLLKNMKDDGKGI